MPKTERKPLEHYLSLQYPVTLIPSEDGGYVAIIKELPGCATQGETREEALEMIEDAKAAWLTDTYESGDPVPLPGGQGYSGKFLIRTPKSLHRNLAELAEEEGVSLNQLVVSLLSRSVSTRR